MVKKKKLKKKNFALLLITLVIVGYTLFYIQSYPFKVVLKTKSIDLNEKFKDQYTATFNGKRIQSNIKIKSNINNKELGTYKINFKYKHKNRTYQRNLKIEVKDLSKPIITLKEGNSIVVIINEKFNDPGYAAIDNYDGNLKDKVITEGTVDTKKEGIYTIKYSVTDSNGNRAIEKRKVEVTKSSPLTMNLKEFSLDSYYKDIQLQETKNGKEEYSNKFIFAGDSTALYYVMNKNITGKQLWHREGVNLETIFNNTIYINHIDSKKTLIDAYEEKKPKYLLLSLGTNSVAAMEIDYFITKFQELLKSMKEKNPEGVIIVQSIFPVASRFDSEGKQLNNQKINKMNYYLLKLCSEMKIPFLNTSSVLKDENGQLKKGYYRDSSKEAGVHLSETGNKKAMEYFQTHMYQK
ncbi:MAG: DUF5011 domain-containing protein [Bacilli bacterium]